MASSTNEYKQYGRNRRQATLQTSFASGMMYSGGTVGDGYVKTLVNYDISVNDESLIPRAGLRTQELLLPNKVLEDYDNTFNKANDIVIKAAKECVESDGNIYRQFILGQTSSNNLWIVTTPLTEGYVERDELPYDELKYTVINENIAEDSCSFFNIPLTKVHGVDLIPDSKVSSIVGDFAFGNSFYYVDAAHKKFKRTVFDTDTKAYKTEVLEPVEISPSEAVSYGYNALLGRNMYSFSNKAYTGILQLTGLLPYSASNPNELLLSPRKNEDILFRCHFNAKVGNKYKFVWEWRTLESNVWESLVAFDKAVEYEVVAGDSNESILLKNGDETIENLEVTFKAPSENIMVRVQAFNFEEYSNLEEGHDPVTEAAMTVGFDFTVNSENTKQTTYDLTTATGMVYWKNRLIVWGLPEDQTVLFFSDLNEPLYFPYPNNVSIFDEPIVSAKVYMDSLLVFTTSKVYQVTTEDGTSWTSTILQSNLNIEPWDRHLIRIVRNMVFFKSGNYYFMIVPKSQSLTGELTLAPVSTPIKDFFNDFRKNVQELLSDTFNVTSEFKIVDYFNFLDYEDVHNTYILGFDDIDSYLYLDIAYNTVNRVWRILTYETRDFLYPYKHDATQTGTLASTSLFSLTVSDSEVDYVIEEKTPVSVCERVSQLDLSEDGFDISTAEPLLVRVFNPTGELDREIRFDVVVLEDENTMSYFTHPYKLVCSISGENHVFSLLHEHTSKHDFIVGSEVVIYKQSDLDTPIWGPAKSVLKENTAFYYDFDRVNWYGSSIVINGITYNLDIKYKDYIASSETDLFKLKLVEDGIMVIFSEPYVLDLPKIKVYPEFNGRSSVGRGIQLYKFDTVNMQDYSIPFDTKLVYTKNAEFMYSLGSIKETLVQAIDTAALRLTFNNWQFLDTGYRNDNTHMNKRFRELQLQVNNIAGEDLEFGMEFLLDGQRRMTYLTFDMEYVADELDAGYGTIYIETVPIENITLPNSTYLGKSASVWKLDQSLFPELSLWKIRVPVSGKGLTPRLRLLSKNPSRFELPGINWIYRIMNMR